MTESERKDGVVAVTNVKGLHPEKTAIFFKTHDGSIVERIMDNWGYHPNQYSITLGSDFTDEIHHDILRPEHIAGEA